MLTRPGRWRVPTGPPLSPTAGKFAGRLHERRCHGEQRPAFVFLFFVGCSMPSFEHGPVVPHPAVHEMRRSADQLRSLGCARKCPARCIAMRPRHCTNANVLCVPDETMYRQQVHNLLCQTVHSVVELASIVACEALSASMQLAPYHHRDIHRRQGGWGKGEMVDTSTLISLCRTSAPALVSSVCILPTGSRKGQLRRRATRPLSTKSETSQTARC